jgi:hypothetical protein
MAIDPLERTARVRLQSAHEFGVAGPAFVLIEQDQPELRGVVCPVVGTVRREAELGVFAAAKLVRDLARLGVAKIDVARPESSRAAACGA